MVIRASELLEHINDPHRSMVILKSHLWIERCLDDALRIASPHPEKLKLDRMSFATKLDLALALGGVDQDVEHLIRKLNTLRNRVAHNLEHRVEDDEVLEILPLFPERITKIARAETSQSVTRRLFALILDLETGNAQREDEIKWGEIRRRYYLCVALLKSRGLSEEEADARARKIADPPPPLDLDEVLIHDLPLED